MMPRIVRLLSFFGALGFASGARRARTPRTASNTSCGSLSHVSAGGKDFGAASWAVCSAWPNKFPVENADELQRLLEEAMEEGGPWDLILKVKEERSGNPSFCWRGNTVRPESESCDMKVRGQCYGACPYGYKPKLLSGAFSPVCNSACSDGDLAVACGFGCAKDISECSSALLRQVGNVTQAVAAVYSVSTFNLAMLKTVNDIIDLVEFIVGTLVKVVVAANKIFGSENRHQMPAVILILFVRSVITIPLNKLGKVPLNSVREFNKVRELVSLASGLFSDRGEVKLDVQSIVTALVSQGKEVVEGAASFVEAFSYPHCHPANDVAFTFDEMGDDRLMGPWVQRGTMNGKPKYTLRGKTSSIVQWKEDHWEVFVDGWCGRLCRKPLYTNDAQTYDFPVEGWKVASGAAPAPEVIAMRPPLEE